ncbi:MAG: transcription termination factor Rho [Candidatus Omnitrophica bacterium]|nr:transcription termination factor Rho [Candidatus Omnitrophota bacterium]
MPINHSYQSGRGRQPSHRPITSRTSDDGLRRFREGTAIDPSPRIRLADGSSQLTMRAMDLICPIGMGQRGLIVAPPGSGKTTFLKHICQAVATSCPAVKLYCMLVDERPEEVTDFRRAVTGDVRASSIDQSYDHHVATADALMAEAVRQAADGENVMVLIDSLTRLSRVHNAERSSSGRTLSGGVDARSLEVPRRIFGSARKIEHGGSLSILATILIETGSRMDEVIFEEFKGTGNMEIVLSREIANRRIFPAIDINRSATRKEELLLAADEIEPIHQLRRVLSGLSPVDAAQSLIDQLQKYPTNKELLQSLRRV